MFVGFSPQLCVKTRCQGRAKEELIDRAPAGSFRASFTMYDTPSPEVWG